MNKYIIHGQSFSGNVTLEYDFNDRLKMILFECDMSNQQHEQFIRQIPMSEADFVERANRSQASYSVIPPDLSFEVFWNNYNYKVGDKNRAKKLWEKLTDAEKVTALKMIPAYNYFLTLKKTDKAYAETWLSQKRFLTNEYR